MMNNDDQIKQEKISKAIDKNNTQLKIQRKDIKD